MPNPRGKALLKEFLALPKAAFADAAPATTAEDWKDAEEFIPLGAAPTRKSRPSGKRQTEEQEREKPARTRKAKRA
jgi:hypothetical protein